MLSGITGKRYFHLLKTSKYISVALLVLVALLTTIYISGYYTTRQQLISPLIPESTVDLLSIPFLKLGLSCLAFLIVGCIAFRFKNYNTASAICATAFLFVIIVARYAIFG